MIRFETTIAALAIGVTISLSSPAAAENVSTAGSACLLNESRSQADVLSQVCG
jgi:hypothetical protein